MNPLTGRLIDSLVKPLRGEVITVCMRRIRTVICLGNIFPIFLENRAKQKGCTFLRCKQIHRDMYMEMSLVLLIRQVLIYINVITDSLYIQIARQILLYIHCSLYYLKTLY